MVEHKSPYFKKHLNWLVFLGIDIFPVGNTWYKYLLYKVYATFVVSFVIMYTLLELIDVFTASNFNNMTFGLCYCATHLLGIAKIVILIVKKDTIQDMITRLGAEPFKPNPQRGGEEEFRLVNAADTRCTKHAELFNLIVYVIVSIRCLYALLDNGDIEDLFDERLNATVPIHKRTLPYRIWLPFDTSSSPIFEIVFFLQPFTLTLFGYYIGLMDSMVYGMMIHMDTQYLIIKQAMERYVDMAKSKAIKKIQDKRLVTSHSVMHLPAGYERIEMLNEYMQEESKTFVHDSARHHILILDFCDEVEIEFSYLMLSQFLFSLYTLVFQLYQLSLMDVMSFEFISMCFYLTLLMYQLFCYCYYGNTIMITSEKFSEYLYNLDWLVLDNSVKKSLLLMMMRAQRPVRFTAGKFALLSLQTFVSIVRGSASYFMVLRQMSAQNSD